MMVSELIDLLKQCNPTDIVIYNAAYEGYLEVNALQRTDTGGLEYRQSWEYLHTVEILNGRIEYMKSQGLDVIGSETISRRTDYCCPPIPKDK